MPITQADVAKWWIANGYHVLNTRQQEVLILRYGLFGEPALGLEATGDRLHPRITAERVRQIETEALAILRETYALHIGNPYGQ